LADKNFTELKKLLDQNVKKYNKQEFIDKDPISIPHLFHKKQDIEIMAFWTAMLAWGQRITIINKSKQLITLMDNSPHDFILNFKASDLKAFLNFKHRTFNATDCLYFLHFFQNHYKSEESLESAFTKHMQKNDTDIGNALSGFHNYFFSLQDAPKRTKKHVATPARKSTCKRLCMFLRWMVRKDNKGVDFGIWRTINTNQLLCPLDVHVERVARNLNLIERKQRDWQTVVELTNMLKKFDPKDPVKYDFALFGMGVNS